MFGRSPSVKALETLVTLSTEAWMQSRAALYLARGDPWNEAADRAREDWQRAHGHRGIRVTSFRLADLRER